MYQENSIDIFEFISLRNYLQTGKGRQFCNNII